MVKNLSSHPLDSLGICFTHGATVENAGDINTSLTFSKSGKLFIAEMDDWLLNQNILIFDSKVKLAAIGDIYTWGDYIIVAVPTIMTDESPDPCVGNVDPIDKIEAIYTYDLESQILNIVKDGMWIEIPSEELDAEITFDGTKVPGEFALSYDTTTGRYTYRGLESWTRESFGPSNISISAPRMASAYSDDNYRQHDVKD